MVVYLFLTGARLTVTQAKGKTARTVRSVTFYEGGAVTRSVQRAQLYLTSAPGGPFVELVAISQRARIDGRSLPAVASLVRARLQRHFLLSYRGASQLELSQPLKKTPTHLARLPARSRMMSATYNSGTCLLPTAARRLTDKNTHPFISGCHCH